MNFDPGTNEAAMEEQSILERMRRDSELTKQTFWDKVKFWEATKPRPEDIEQQIKVRKKISMHQAIFYSIFGSVLFFGITVYDSSLKNLF